jgi:hypothetical protein
VQLPDQRPAERAVEVFAGRRAVPLPMFERLIEQGRESSTDCADTADLIPRQSVQPVTQLA